MGIFRWDIRAAAGYGAHDKVRRGALAVILVAAFTLVVDLLCACSASAPSGRTVFHLDSYYEESGFSQQDGRYAYVGERGASSKTGVDVSENQGWIDWDAVAGDAIDFAIVRVGYRGTTEGGLFQDDYFEYNTSAARAVGLECGAYFFSQAVTVEEAQEEAAFAISVLGGMPLEYPVVFDHERHAPGIDSRVDNLTPEEATAIALAFCQAIEAAGYDAAIYGNGYDLARYDLDELGGYPLWYAEYGTLPSSTQPFAIWQYTNDGRVAGIDAAVDLNLDLRG